MGFLLGLEALQWKSSAVQPGYASDITTTRGGGGGGGGGGERRVGSIHQVASFAAGMTESWRRCGCRMNETRGLREGEQQLTVFHSHAAANTGGRCLQYSVSGCGFSDHFQLRRVEAQSILLGQHKSGAGSFANSSVSWLRNGDEWRAGVRVPLRIFWQFRSLAIEGTGIGKLNFFSQFPRRGTDGAIRSTSTSSYLGDYGGSLSSHQAGNGKDRGAALEEGSAQLGQPPQQQQSQKLRSGNRNGVFLATGLGWRVRDAERGELRELVQVADIQTNAFHEKAAIFDELFHKIFHAEVLTSLQYKAKQFDPTRYACLLAEMDPSQANSVDEGEFQEVEQRIVGAVDITALDDKDILCHLPEAYEYLYVSGMAVDPKYRRRGVATLLLDACLNRAIEWSFNYLVLHAYEDDFRARNLYSRAGYVVVGADPAWMSKFLGRRRRVVMAKRLDGELPSPVNEVF